MSKHQQQSEPNPKLPSKRGRPVNQEKDRVTFHINIEIRNQIENLIPDMGKSLSMVVRNLVNLGLEVVGLSKKGLTTPRVGNVKEWLANYTSLGTELAIACETLNLSAPKPGQVAIWLLDKMAFGSNNPQVIHEDEDNAVSLLEGIRLGKKLQAFSLKQAIKLPTNEEFDTWLGQLHGNAVIGQELVATCKTLGLQRPEKGKLQDWLEDMVAQKEASNYTELDSASGNLQPFLDYLFTLKALPTEDEEQKIAHQFGVEPVYVKRLISRMRFDEHLN
ncbi:hypothetical protein DSM106972_066930 [Dulcicalothrix desertica PCC 7102]|uniref:Uncharacterized protein n=1 Tax=Dulcicalothrix desertica PCC 7102 TaxID=232991 RepID=A0A433V677_9CYAN|nr:hypothetical protein [Dulcicalothrix desertica]RUT01596.1 hypothetical protein DSM106972_066930 [Dulcicalothrix desertica PCC 7102]